MTTLVIESVARLALIEDGGRPDQRSIGVPPSGAADRQSLAQGNRVLGNASTAAGVELLLGGLVVRALGPALVCVTGAPAETTVDDRPAPFGSVIALREGQRLAVGDATGALRTYLTVRGGIVASAELAEVLGSLSSDPTSGLGPVSLRPGDELQVGTPSGEPHVGLSIPGTSVPSAGVELRATWGPRADWLTDQARTALTHTTWTVATQTDRVGVRFDGPPLALRRDEQLASEGLVRGCVQVPPSGQPIAFLADHPTTGGYPVVAVLDDADTDVLAQLLPGTDVRLHLRHARWVTSAGTTRL